MRLRWRPGNEAGVEAWERGWGGGLGTTPATTALRQQKIDGEETDIKIQGPPFLGKPNLQVQVLASCFREETRS